MQLPCSSYDDWEPCPCNLNHGPSPRNTEKQTPDTTRGMEKRVVLIFSQCFSIRRSGRQVTTARNVHTLTRAVRSPHLPTEPLKIESTTVCHFSTRCACEGIFAQTASSRHPQSECRRRRRSASRHSITPASQWFRKTAIARSRT